MSTVPFAPTPAIAAVAPVARAGAPHLVADGARALAVSPGQLLVARVLSAVGDRVQLAIAGGRMSARSDAALVPGQVLRLVVDEVGEERVSLRALPAPAAAAGDGSPRSALAGLSAPAGRALMAALADAGVPAPPPPGMAALAGRATAAGVSSPATAAAFARLLAAGLPVTPAAVAGLAGLIEGPPLGRALAGLVDAATPAMPRLLPAGAPVGSAAPPATGAAASAPTPATDSPPGPGSRAVGVAAESGTPIAQPPPIAGTAAAPAALAELVRRLEALIGRVAMGVVSGDGELLRAAIEELGRGLEARLATGRPPEGPPVRALLVALASHPAADPVLARLAFGLADAIGAQGVAAAATSGASTATDPAAGAYLQVPLPDGQTAEIRVAPDAGRDRGDAGDRSRTLAFLLHLSNLGPVAIQAAAGPGGVEAIVRLQAPEARRFVAGRLDELARALEGGAGRARVRVEPLALDAPTHLLDPPAASGLDLRA